MFIVKFRVIERSKEKKKEKKKKRKQIRIDTSSSLHSLTLSSVSVVGMNREIAMVGFLIQVPEIM